jgi:hypothetical protein
MEKNKAFMVRASDDEATYLLPENGKFFTLEELQKIVGGYVEVRALSRPIRYKVKGIEMVIETPLMICNEDGKNLGLEVNALATAIYQIVEQHQLDFTVGTIVFCDFELFK